MVDFSAVPFGSVIGSPGGSTAGPLKRIGAPPNLPPRHLRWPLLLGPDGAFATLEQDSIEEVQQSVEILLTTRVGERYREAPDYGIPEPLTGDPVNTSAAAGAVTIYEPRAAVTFTAGNVSAQGAQLVTVGVDVIANSADVTPSLDRAS